METNLSKEDIKTMGEAFVGAIIKLTVRVVGCSLFFTVDWRLGLGACLLVFTVFYD